MTIWQRICIRCGLIVCAPAEHVTGRGLDHLMVAHFRCRQCGKKSESPVFDPRSESERFACQYCGTEYSGSKLTGEPIFRILELAEHYLRDHPTQAAAIKAGRPPAGLLWRILFSRREPLPPHRDGQTLGALEADALGKLFFSITHDPSLFK